MHGCRHIADKLLIVTINVNLPTILIHGFDVRRITASFVLLYKMKYKTPTVLLMVKSCKSLVGDRGKKTYSKRGKDTFSFEE